MEERRMKHYMAPSMKVRCCATTDFGRKSWSISCPDRNMEAFNQLSHYEGLSLLPSVCGWILIQQTLIRKKQ